MNYFLFTSKYTDLHYEESKKYISQQYKNGDLVKVSFNDENYADYMCDSGGMEIIKETVVFVFGEDGYYYRLFKDHTEKGEKYPPGMPKRVIKQTLRLVKQVRANKKYQKNLVRRFKSKTVAKLGGAAGFRRYIYLNGADGITAKAGAQSGYGGVSHHAEADDTGAGQGKGNPQFAGGSPQAENAACRNKGHFQRQGAERAGNKNPADRGKNLRYA